MAVNSLCHEDGSVYKGRFETNVKCGMASTGDHEDSFSLSRKLTGNAEVSKVSNKASKLSTLGVLSHSFMPFPASDERDGGNNGVQGNSGDSECGHNNQGSSSGSGGREDKRKKPPHLSKGRSKHIEEEMKMEAKRVKSFGRNWPHSFLRPKDMAEAGFYLITDDVVRCPFCKIEVAHWVSGDIPRKEHKRWSGNCPFMRGVPCGNVPIRDNEASSSASDNEVYSEDSSVSYDVCGIHEEMRPFSFCDDETSGASASSNNTMCLNSKILGSDVGGGTGDLPRSSLEKLGVRDIRAPVHPEYCSEAARLASFNQWPVSIKQRPKDLAEAGFYYTGNSDQAICFHCGGGLKDWEDGDDPWVEHAKWFSKCHFLNLVKGRDFVLQTAGSRPALMTAEEVKGLMNPSPDSETASSSNAGQQENVLKSSSSSNQTATSVETIENKAEETKEIGDNGRLCKICYSAELGVVFLPCGHMVACVRCAPSLSVCPVCRQPFSHTVRAFLS